MIVGSDSADDAFNDILLPSTSSLPTEQKAIKFQPKPRGKPKKPAAGSAALKLNQSDAEVLTTIEKEDAAIVATDVSSIASSSCVQMDISSEVNEANELVSVTEGLTHEVTCDGPIASKTDRVSQTDAYKHEEEEMSLFTVMDSHDDIFLQPSDAAAVKKAGKFQPKSCMQSKKQQAKSATSVITDASQTVASSVEPETALQPREKKAKSVTFSLPDAADSHVEAHSDILANNLLGSEPSFMQIINDEDNTPQLTTTISDSEDFQLDHVNVSNEDLADLSGLESFDNILPEPTSVAERAVPKFRPKPGTKKKTVKSSSSAYASGAKDSTLQLDALPVDIEPLEDLNFSQSPLCSEHGDLVDMPCIDSGSPRGIESLETIDATLDRDNHIAWERNFLGVSEDRGNDGVQTEEILDDQSQSKASEEHDFGKSSRKLRKRSRTAAHSSSFKIDGGISENHDVENSGQSQIDANHDDGENGGKNMPKKRKQPKRSKKQITTDADVQKPAKKCTKSSKEPDSIEPEQVKKRFPHGTRRKRRQVDKTLLETPEDELNPRHIAINQLILLAEAKERIGSKGAAALNNNQSNTDSIPGGNYHDRDDPYGEYFEPDIQEEHRNRLRNSRKINYMTHMAKRQREKWSKAETELFYQAIRQFGTDFGMIAQLFPNRTREQVKSKFKLEERKHPAELHDAMSDRSGDHSHYEKVIQLLQAQAAEESRLDDADADLTTVSQDVANGNEEGGELPDNPEPKADEFDGITDLNDGGEADYDELNEWDADGITDLNEQECAEWDADASFHQDEKKYSEEKYSEFEKIF